MIETRAEVRRYKTWSKDEETRALALCTGDYAHMLPVIVCVTDGGFRRGELLGAKWTDVDFENEFVLAKNRKGNEERVRRVYMTRRMKAALLEWKKLQKKADVSDSQLMIGYADVKKAWNQIRKKIGREDLRLHDLRHVFGSRLSTKKVPLRNISLLLGHEQVSTTQLYLNPIDDELRNSAKALED